MKREFNKDHTQKHTHFAAQQANTKTKAAKRVCFSSARKNCIKKISFPSKILKTLHTIQRLTKNNMTITAEMKRHTYLTDKNRQHLTGVCCQWRDSASYDSDEHIETFFLRGKFSGKIATEQQPPKRYE